MAANEGLLSSTRGSSVPSINPENIPLWTVQIGAFFMRFPGVKEAWDAVIPAKESAEQRQERISIHGDAAKKAYSYLVEACIPSPVALLAVVAHQTLDADLWPNTLRKMLETRFTLQASNRLQNHLTAFSQLKMTTADKTGVTFMDRYNQKIAEISSINVEELPTPLLRCTVLKGAVKDSFPITHALMANTKATSNKGLESKLVKMIINCEEPNSLVVKQELEAVAIANMTQLTNEFPRKRFIKKENAKSGRPIPKQVYERKCYGCDSPDHLVANCPENTRGGGEEKFW